MCIVALFSCVACMQSVEANTASPKTERVMKKVQRLLDQKAWFWAASYVKKTYDQLLEKGEEEDLHPYVKSNLRRMTSQMRERYAFLATNASLWETNQVIKNWTVQKRNQIALFPKKVQVDSQEKQDIPEHTVADEQDKTQDVFEETEENTYSRVEVESEPEEVSTTKDIEEKVEINQQQNETPEKTIEVVPFDDSQDRWYALGNGRINVSELTRVWIRWVNDFRKEEWVEKEIVHQPLLDKTATEHSYYQRSIGEWTHRRTPQSAFYDYGEINQWFLDRWVAFTNINRATHTENVWLSTLYCDGWDCTDEAATSLSWVFEYFINEKWTSYTADYDTIVQPYFGEMWFGIAIDEDTNMIYSTMHYGTQAVRRPVQLTSR